MARPKKNKEDDEDSRSSRRSQVKIVGYTIEKDDQGQTRFMPVFESEKGQITKTIYKTIAKAKEVYNAKG
jgi:hypothetical protein